MNTLIAVLTIIGLGSMAHAQNSPYPETQEAIDEEIITLPWEYEMKEYSLDQSNSAFKLSEGFALLRGDAARRFDFLTQGMEDSDTEALIYNQDTEIQMIFNYSPSGYVSLDDWSDLDADELLKQISENTEKGNAQRTQHNFSSLKIGGWIQKPRLNRENNSVSWVFDVIDGEEKYVNAISIKLGRKGYETITWVSSYENYLKSMDLMGSLVDQQTFNKGYRYADYSIGSDKLAAFGIASLVAVTAGGNQHTKAGLLAGVLVFGKKLMVPFVIALGAMGAYFRKLFGNKSPEPQTDPSQV